jgi:hypothetical protein
VAKGGWIYITANRYRGGMYVGVAADLPRRAHCRPKMSTFDPLRPGAMHLAIGEALPLSSSLGSGVETVLFALLFAAALWMGDLYNASKFRFFYPELKADLLPQDAARWKRVWVFRNQSLKRAGLFTVWVGITLGRYFFHESEAVYGRAFYAVSFLGLVLYAASRLWPALVEKRPRRR